MQLLLVIAMFVLSTTTPSHSQNAPVRTPAQIKDDLIRIEREIGRANLDCDYRYFDRVEGDDFIFTDSSGNVSDKKQDMAGEKDCRKTEGSYDVDETEVRIYGQTVVVTGRVTTTVKNKAGETVVRRSRFTDVFVWRDGRWQLVAGHSSRIPSPTGA